MPKRRSTNRHLFLQSILPILLLCSLNHDYSIAAVSLPPPDALALLAFKSMADLGNNLRFSAASFCRWQGVKCVGEKVGYLILNGVALGGVIPTGSITRLDQLRVLSLQNDSLTGSIPDLTGLFNLKILFLDHNSFTGILPPSISSLHRLRTIGVSSNDLTGSLPLSLAKLPRLHYLRLDKNGFNGAIPPFNQSSLRYFNVSDNKFSGAVPVTPVLLRFGPSSFSSNPFLCGRIVSRECDSIRPFFESDNAPRPMAVRGLHGRYAAVEDLNRTRRRERDYAVSGFSFGVFFLLASIVCLAIALKKKKERSQKKVLMSSSATSAAAAVMRIEEADELAEKVKKKTREQSALLSGQKSVGSLAFCAGEPHEYNAEQLMRASAEFLGKGTMGTTYKAVLDGHQIVCVKRLDVGKTANIGRESFELRMKSIGGLRHPNLVPLRSYFQAKHERLLVYDYQPNGTLFSLIHGSKSAHAKPLHWTSCLKIAEDVARGLSYIHRQPYRLVHGNLKSSNVLLGADFEARLTDYCLAGLLQSLAADEDPDSAAYRAPEIRKIKLPTSSSDVYAFGVLLLVLLTGVPPSQHPDEDLTKWVGSARGEREVGKMELVLEVALACTADSPRQRPAMFDVLKMIQKIKEAVLTTTVPETQ